MQRPALTDRLLELWRERALIVKAMSFAAVGVVNSVIDFGVFFVAVQYFGAPLVMANVLSWLVAVSNSYVLNSTVTFARESGRQLRLATYLKFLVSGLAGLAVNTTVLVLAMQIAPRFIGDPALQLAAAKACAIMASFLVNFTLSYLVVFRKKGAH